MNPLRQYRSPAIFGIAFFVAVQLHAQTALSRASEPAAMAVRSENGETNQGDFARKRQANAVMGKPLDSPDEAQGPAEVEPMTRRQIAVWSLVSIASATLITGAVFGLAAGFATGAGFAGRAGAVSPHIGSPGGQGETGRAARWAIASCCASGIQVLRSANYLTT